MGGFLDSGIKDATKERHHLPFKGTTVHPLSSVRASPALRMSCAPAQLTTLRDVR